MKPHLCANVRTAVRFLSNQELPMRFAAKSERRSWLCRAIRYICVIGTATARSTPRYGRIPCTSDKADSWLNRFNRECDDADIAAHISLVHLASTISLRPSFALNPHSLCHLSAP